MRWLIPAAAVLCVCSSWALADDAIITQSPSGSDELARVEVRVLMGDDADDALVMQVEQGQAAEDAARAFLQQRGLDSDEEESDSWLRSLVEAADRERGRPVAIDSEESMGVPGYPLQVLAVYVTLDGNRTLRLTMREGETTDVVAREFVRRHGLPSEVMTQVFEALEAEYDRVAPRVLGTLALDAEEGGVAVQGQWDVWSHVPVELSARRFLHSQSIPSDSAPAELVATVTDLLRDGMSQLEARRESLQRQAQAAALRDAAESAPASEAARWATASLVVAGQAFDLEFRVNEDGTTGDLSKMGREFCQNEWALLEPLLQSELQASTRDDGERITSVTLDDCAQVIRELLQVRVDSLALGVPDAVGTLVESGSVTMQTP